MTALFLLLSAPSQVMRETDTQVKWPSKLKIGAKSKKGDESLLCSSSVSSLTVAGVVQKFRRSFNFHIDPHVKVEGKRDDVMEAKKRILKVLETKVSALLQSRSTINNKQ